MFLIPISSDKKKLETYFENFETILKLFKSKKNWIYGIYAVLALLGICLFIPAMIPNVSTNAKFPCIIVGLLLFTSIPYIEFLITYIFNKRLTLNRYAYAYSIIKDNLNTLKDCTKKFENIDKKIQSNDKPDISNMEQQYFIFINQCMSYYFGDNNWFLDREKSEDYTDENNGKNNKTKIQKIEISVDKTAIIVTLTNSETYEYIIQKTFPCVKKPASTSNISS